MRATQSCLPRTCNTWQDGGYPECARRSTIRDIWLGDTRCTVERHIRRVSIAYYTLHACGKAAHNLLSSFTRCALNSAKTTWISHPEAEHAALTPKEGVPRRQRIGRCGLRSTQEGSRVCIQRKRQRHDSKVWIPRARHWHVPHGERMRRTPICWRDVWEKPCADLPASRDVFDYAYSEPAPPSR